MKLHSLMENKHRRTKHLFHLLLITYYLLLNSIRKYLFPIIFLCSLTCSLWLSQIPSLAQLPATTEANQLVNEGAASYHEGNYKRAIASWQTALNTYQQNNNDAPAAIVQENLARAYQQIGNTQAAIASWQEVIDYHHNINDLKTMGRMLTEQAQVYSSVGQGNIAIKLLCNEPAIITNLAPDATPQCLPNTALSIARIKEDTMGKVSAWGSLAEIYRLRGDYQRALAYGEVSLEIAEETNQVAYIASASNSIGNSYSGLAKMKYRLANSAKQRGDEKAAETLTKDGLNYDKEALKYLEASYQQTLDEENISGQVKALLNALPIYYRTKNFDKATEKKRAALALFPDLPDSQSKVYTAITLTKLLQPETISHLRNLDFHQDSVKVSDSFLDTSIAPNQCLPQEIQPQAFNLLQTSETIATNLGDARTQSFAWGELAHLYECQGNYQKALQLTQKARLAAEQGSSSPDSLYLWEWQAARIFEKQNQTSLAIDAYQSAITTLETIRDDLLTANRDLQFDFRDTVNPIYREFITLNLENIPTAQLLPAETPTSKKINSILSNIDALRLAELQNYFGSDCIIRALNPTRVDLADNNSTTAIFSSVILGENTAIIATFPDGSKKVALVNKTPETLREEIIQFRRELEARRNDYNLTTAQQVYQDIIAPFADDLQQAQVNTLVFIQDGILRSVPMAALHDGKQFLIETYAIATTPSLTLTDPNSFNRQNLRALALGSSEKISIDGLNFTALPNVIPELQIIEEKLPGSKQLLNQEFTKNRLQQELNTNTYPILHIATHAQFGAVPEDTFLITGNSEKLTLKQLDILIRTTPQATTPIELLSLTACETAIGDERAALGLGGIALQAGARSVLASLWSIPDQQTPQIVENFYTNLQNPNLNKAQALKIAQKQFIQQGGEYSHPAYWAPFILIGNWI